MPANGPKVGNPNSYVAEAAVTQYRFVKRGAAADGVVPATAASTNVGVALDNQDTVGQPVLVADDPSDKPLVEAGGAIAVGAKVTSDANGKAVTAAAGNPVSAIALAAASGAGDLIPVALLGHIPATA